MYYFNVFVLVFILFSQSSLQQICPPTESFENGLTGWTMVDLVAPFYPAVVQGAGSGPGFGFFSSAPTDGSYSFQNGFDANTPSNLTLTKTLTIGSTIQLDYRYAWDLTSYCSGDCRPRYFLINFYSTGDVLLQSTQILASTYSIVSDSGVQTATVDTSALNGMTVKMQFVWVVPQSSTGPAFFELDNIRFSNCIPAFTCTPSCQNGGTCVAANTCSCPSNYTGAVCEHLIATPTLAFTPTGECPSMASTALSSPMTFADPVPYGSYVIGARLQLDVTTFCNNTNITAVLNGVDLGTQTIGPLCSCATQTVLFDVFFNQSSVFWYGKNNNTLSIQGDNIAWTSPVLDLYITNQGCPDNVAPVINVCPSPMSLVASSSTCGSNTPDFTPTAEGVDSCGIVFASQNITVGSFLAPGSYPVQVTLSDYYGASASCDTQVTVYDYTNPTVSCPPPVNLFADATCQAALPSMLASFTASDACGVTKSQNPAASTLIPYGLNYVNASATDSSGNSASCLLSVYVIDTTDPVVTCPADITIAACSYHAENFTSQLNFSDNCGIASISQSPSMGTFLELGSHQVNISVTDIAGNQGFCSFMLNVVDFNVPVITCDDTLVLPVDQQCQVSLPNVTGLVTAQDDCILFVDQTPAADSQFWTTGNYSIWVSASDLQGNAVDCQKEVQIIDNIFPVAQCTSEITLQVDGTCQVLVPSLVETSNLTDNCGIAQTVQSPAAGSSLSTGNYSVNLTASDYFNNQAGCSTTLYVVDDIFPLIACPASIIINASETCGATFPDFMALSNASDNCEFTLSQFPAVGTPLGLGEYSVTVRVTDYAGNFQECNSSVIVVDASKPSLPNCVPARVHQQTDCDPDPDQYELPSFLVDGFEMATENCNLTKVIQSPLPGTKVPKGVYNVTLTFIDASGNEMTCITEFKYEDAEPKSAGMSKDGTFYFAEDLIEQLSLEWQLVFLEALESVVSASSLCGPNSRSSSRSNSQLLKSHNLL